MTREARPQPPGSLAVNTLYAASGRIAGIVIWVAFIPSIYRLLGEAAFGVWSLFFALTGYLTAFDFGLAQGALRHLAAARAHGGQGDTGGVATLAVIGYVGLGAFWLSLMPWIRDPLLRLLNIPPAALGAAEFVFVAGALVFVVMGLFNVVVAVLQSHDRFDLANGVVLAQAALQAIGLGLVLRMQLGVEAIVVFSGSAWLLAVLVGVLLIRRALPGFRWGSVSEALAHREQLLRFGGPMQVANVLSVAHQQLDKVLLARFASFGLVAPYELGLRVSSAGATLPQLLLLAVLPAVARLDGAGDRSSLRRLHDQAQRLALAATAVLSAALLASADRVFVAWLGRADAAATLALQGLAVTAALAMTTGLASTITRGIARTDLEVEFAAIALATHVVLGLWLTPLLGLRGALIAIATGNLLGGAWFLARVSRTMGWPWAETCIRPLYGPLAAVAAGVAAGHALDRWLGPVSGAPAWGALAAVAGAATLVAILVLQLAGAISVRDVLARLRGALRSLK